ncbi:hypothetical protein A33Q_1362 [Indibacter alkaliphilus LW1]|uniref:Uncharacterized protein n=1 Tax=Indibacter alkaliphilus (strain CCUG 57479 / KCTC 22604 / LW1) TaxID=1189612 RepID=S2E8S0_INDAL|nr:hypothetical protein A33Q_1362 [Indibacter alkaliphilus LW1]
MCANFLKVQSFILMIFENIFSISKKLNSAIFPFQRTISNTEILDQN